LEGCNIDGRLYTVLKNRFSGINAGETVETTKEEEWKQRKGNSRSSANPLFCNNRRTQGGCHKLNDVFLGCRYFVASGQQGDEVVDNAREELVLYG
jgi:hypothetical protein